MYSIWETQDSPYEKGYEIIDSIETDNNTKKKKKKDVRPAGNRSLDFYIADDVKEPSSDWASASIA